MSEAWLSGFNGPTGLRELRVEYETLTWKKAEMMAIVERNKKWKLAVQGEEGHLSAEGTKLVEWKWNGPAKLGGRKWRHHGEGDTVEYVVVTDTWKYDGRPMSEEDAARRNERFAARESEEDEDSDSDISSSVAATHGSDDEGSDDEDGSELE